MIERRDVFQAIADPTRRVIIHKLCGGPLNITQIGENFDISKQAIAKHLKILEECGVISVSKNGRERVCRIRINQLDEVMDWVTTSRQIKKKQFNKLDQFLKASKT